MDKEISKLKKEWQERSNFFFDKYGKMDSVEVLAKRHREGLPLNPIFDKHKEAVWLIDEIIELKDRGYMTRSRAKELIAGVIDEHINKPNFSCQGFECGKISERCDEKCELC